LKELKKKEIPLYPAHVGRQGGDLIRCGRRVCYGGKTGAGAKPLTIRIHFEQTGIDENPFRPRLWPLVPRIGEMVFMPETQNAYRVLSVVWQCEPKDNDDLDLDQPIVRVELQIEPRSP